MKDEALPVPASGAHVVLDTDAWNEADDQFAISYLLRSEPEIRTEAIYAAPFFNAKVSSPEEGMEKSFAEIRTLLTLNGREDLSSSVFSGSRAYLPDETTPVDSPAARDLVRRAAGYCREDPLWVVGIGCITNIASAILLDPSIADRIAVVWLGGHARHWHDTKEFNLRQDIAAARVVMDSGAPFVQIPCMGVASEFRTTRYELEHWIGGRNPLCDHLLQGTFDKVRTYAPLDSAWSRVIWDVVAVAFLLNRDERFLLTREEKILLPGYDGRYETNGTKRRQTYVYGVKRDALMEDLFRKLTR